MSAYSQFGYNYPASAVPALSSTAVQLLGGSSGSSGGGPPQGGARVSSSYLPPSSLTISPGSSTTSSTTTPHGPTTPGSITGLPPSATTRDTMLPGGTRGGNPSSRLSSPASSTSSIGSSPTGGVGVGGTSLPLLPGSTPASTSGLGAGSGAVGGGSTTSTGIAAPSRTSCCETGRPIATDPHTGQSICSCQYTPSTAAALLSYPRMTAGLPHPSSGGDPLYGSPYAVAAAAQAYAMPLTADTSAFYSPLNYDLKDRADAWSAIAQPTPCYPYDPTMGYAYGQSALAQRKNATREATSTLKAWLTEHIKNPYPTKGEKIMLAIITKMTLTQVSTWFANARRRLKKENKMVWSPRNRSDEEGEGGKDSDDDMDDDVTDKDGGDVRHGAGSIGHGDEDDEIHVIDNGLDDVNPLHNDKLDATPPACAKQQQPIGSMNTGTMTPLGGSAAASPNKTGSTSPVKPRIWSIADVATSGHSSIKEPTGSYPHTVQHRPLPGAPGMMNGVAGGGAGGEVSAAGLGYKDPYGHIPGMNGFRPWIHSSPYPCTTSHHPAFTSALSQTHVAGSAPPIPGTLGLPPSVSGSSGAPSVPALGGSTLPPSGLPTASLGGSGSAAAAAAASGLLRPYPISARAEVH